MRLNQRVMINVEIGLARHQSREAKIIAKSRFGGRYILKDCKGTIWRLNKEDIFPVYSKKKEDWKES